MAASNSLFVRGLFPEFGKDHLGGIQVSGDIAWQAVSENSAADLFSYEAPRGTPWATQRAFSLRTKSIFSALTRRGNPDLLLVWQIGLLKLLPFFLHQPRKVVLFLHGIEAWKKQDWLTRELLKRVDLFLCNSDHTWRQFSRYNPSRARAPHSVVPLGIYTPVTYETRAPLSPPAALILSRLDKTEDYKGHRELITTWPWVLKLQPQAQLWIAGDGNLRRDLEILVSELGLEESVKFYGKVSERKKEELLRGSRCLVMPSRGEGFGLVYLEAMRLGRPCLVSTFDAGREVVNPPEAGLAVDPTIRAELAASLSRLLSDGTEWENWSINARRRYEANYTAVRFQERLLKVLFAEKLSAETASDRILEESVVSVPQPQTEAAAFIGWVSGRPSDRR
ncbi:MAG TPA: glycosyltransferase family 4 protein [Pyrinomonadaceae bacterium]|nr:glycosyltransferase family 4 protein [Pyrinomonadaceae bacterium]